MLTRRSRVFTLAGTVFFSVKKTQRRAKRLQRRLGLSDDAAEEHPELARLWRNTHERNAARLLVGINSLQGFWIKVSGSQDRASSRVYGVPPFTTTGRKKSTVVPRGASGSTPPE